MAKPTSWREAIEPVKAVYASPRGGAGCCLHIVTDDDNVEDSSVDFCIEEAKMHGHGLCLTAATLLRAMSMTQRSKLCQHYSLYCTQPSIPSMVRELQR